MKAIASFVITTSVIFDQLILSAIFALQLPIDRVDIKHLPRKRPEHPEAVVGLMETPLLKEYLRIFEAQWTRQLIH